MLAMLAGWLLARTYRREKAVLTMLTLVAGGNGQAADACFGGCGLEKSGLLPLMTLTPVAVSTMLAL